MLTALLSLYLSLAVAGGCYSLWTIGAEEARRHPLAAALTAAVCGLLWPILVFADLNGKDRRL